MDTLVYALESFVASGTMISPEFLFAYLDPGTGSILLQFIVAGLLSIAAFFKFYWRLVVGLFQRKAKPMASDETNIEQNFNESEEKSIKKKAA